MYEFIRGIVVSTQYPFVVLDVGGVGYRLRVPLPNHHGLKESAEATLFASLYVREDQMTLYGFATREERSVFERLISVSGVGPNIGLQILSTLDPNDLQNAILNEDYARIGQVKGIGPKLARRIVLEIKGLVSELFGPSPDSPLEEKTKPGPPNFEAALAALQKLGYPRKAAAQALAKVDDSTEEAEAQPTENLVRAALRIL